MKKISGVLEYRTGNNKPRTIRYNGLLSYLWARVKIQFSDATKIIDHRSCK